ncbi:hypothetical protein [Erythrobacter sp. MTPC3]|uniref:hypothetical protein n=1 Tax=Erythrobacter sp. MTPC3 TaxID=3056564 RepID=UPI0036F36D81
MLDLIFFEYRPMLQDLLTIAVCIGAYFWGSAPERLVAITWVLVFEVPGRLYRAVSEDGLRLTGTDAFLATTDVVAGIVWIGIALYANRNYTLLIASMQVLAMTAHVARSLADTISPVAYVTMVAAPGWFQLIFLGIGILMHRKREERYGPYRDWRIPINIPLLTKLPRYPRGPRP